MKRLAAIVLTLLALMLATTCLAQTVDTTGVDTQQRKDRIVGFKCPDREPDQLRPDVPGAQLGDVTKKAIKLPPPFYSREARVADIKGRVRAEVVIDVNSGHVVWARIFSGHPLLQPGVIRVVCRARFAPTIVEGRPMRVSGILTYRFGTR